METFYTGRDNSSALLEVRVFIRQIRWKKGQSQQPVLQSLQFFFSFSFQDETIPRLPTCLAGLACVGGAAGKQKHTMMWWMYKKRKGGADVKWTSSPKLAHLFLYGCRNLRSVRLFSTAIFISIFYILRSFFPPPKKDYEGIIGSQVCSS